MRNLFKMGTREIMVRVFADYALVHLSMLAALSATVTSFVLAGKHVAAQETAHYFPQYYWAFFWPLSIIFPLVFLATGTYTRSATYAMPYKLFVLLRGALISILVFLAFNYLIFREDLISRGVSVWFAFILPSALVAIRYFKATVLKYVASEQRPATVTAPDPGLVLVVGGAGYIGSILVRRLLESGYRVRVFDSLLYGGSAIEGVLEHPNLQLVVGDCRNIQAVVGAVRGVTTIVDLAAIVGDPACEQDRLTALETNLAATRMIIEVAKGYGVKRFVFASSCSVYGITDFVVDEHSALNPVSLYAQTKVDSEQALLSARSESFHPTILRFATVFGNSYRPRFDLVVNLLTAKAVQEGVITIFNGEQWRPFIHVRDVAEAILHSVKSDIGLVSGQIFNVGSQHLNYTLGQVAEKIEKVFPAVQVEHVENSDRRNYRVSFDKLHKQLGFECRYTLEDGILELKEAFEQGRIRDYRNSFYSNLKYLQGINRPLHAGEVDGRVMAAFAAPSKEPAASFPAADVKVAGPMPDISAAEASVALK
jgi:nucleoside-diphosphate-sugar epimerase